MNTLNGKAPGRKFWRTGSHSLNKEDYLDTAASVVLKIMLIVALFCPISTTMEGSRHPQYYQEFLLVNAVAVVFLLFYGIATIWQKRWNRENLVFCIKFLFVMCCYVFFYYLMMDSIQWKWQGVNCVISFGFFLLLMCGRNQEWFDRHHIIEFANRSIVISNLIGILVYLQGYASVYWYDFKFQLMLPQAFYGEKRFEWIYYHKSQYAFMLLLSLAFVLVHRKKFINRVTLALSIAVLLAGLGRAPLRLPGEKIRGGTPQKIAAERSVLTLGSRTYIWQSAIDLILKRPEGLGLRFTFKKLHLEGLGGMVTTNNGHNIFLNEILRLSIPVGVCFIIFFVLIIVYSLEKKFSFFTLGIWGALLMSMMMDYAVMNSGWTLMVFFFYTIFFLDVGARKKEAAVSGAGGEPQDDREISEATSAEAAKAPDSPDIII